ncbi:hypothetical protein [Pseudonocardia endophytica]|uniref:Uncharacterized protein n=1 Tax=Pseudonocardia endophytica TaxID=401976 RepID=A0A4R1HJD4_PSEEN|nr:hypothetical protein [Pseudonocardia endophytica]TCK20605.1 hypothetical protein EV378_4566 [Pseudonocardia endophytica]
MSSDENAVDRYRDVVARLAGAVVELRERDALRVEELRRELRAADRELHDAAEALVVAEGMFELRWESALQMMWATSEPGKPRPRPDHRADPARHDALEVDADEALQALRAAGDRRLFRLRRDDG